MGRRALPVKQGTLRGSSAYRIMFSPRSIMYPLYPEFLTYFSQLISNNVEHNFRQVIFHPSSLIFSSFEVADCQKDIIYTLARCGCAGWNQCPSEWQRYLINERSRRESWLIPSVINHSSHPGTRDWGEKYRKPNDTISWWVSRAKLP